MKAPKIFFEPYHYAERAAPARRAARDGALSLEGHFTRYFGRRAIIAPNGRMAISLIMKSLDLRPGDEIYITTTFEKPNVSSCVTSTIFNFCKPSRVLTEKARAILIIHEFGVPHPRLKELAATARKRGIPLIEDCAHSIDSRGPDGILGRTGDYAICSFTKIFPVRYGGLLIGEGISYTPSASQAAIIEDLRRIMPRYLTSLSAYSLRKRMNFRLLEKRCASISLKPLFRLEEGTSPSFFFPVVTDRFEELLDAAAAAGIECALWHGTNVVVLPMHQFLSDQELDRIFMTIKAAHAKKRPPRVAVGTGRTA